MLCSVDNNQVLQKILSSSTLQIKKFLAQQDEKYIVWRKNQIIQNMPNELKPNDKIQQKSVSTLLKNIIHDHSSTKKASLTSNSMFPTMFQQKCNEEYYKTMQKFNYGDWKKKLSDSKLSDQVRLNSGNFLNEGANNVLGYQIENQQILKTNGLLNNQLATKTQIQKTPPQNNNNVTLGPQQNNILQQQHQKSFQQSQKQLSINKLNQSASKNPFLLLPQKYSPFIPNQSNFLDIHSNKKYGVQSYLSPEMTSMNLLQYNQLKKQENVFDDGYSYPNAVMGGTGVGIMKTAKEMRTNPFTKTFAAGSAGFYNTSNKNQKGFNSPNNFYKQQQKDYQTPQNPHIQSKFHEQVVQNVLKYNLNDKRYAAHTRIQQRVGRTNNQVNNNNSSTISRMIAIRQQQQMSSYVNTNKNNPNEQQAYMQSTHNKNPNSYQNKNQRILQNPFVRRPNSNYKR